MIIFSVINFNKNNKTISNRLITNQACFKQNKKQKPTTIL